ncbi:MAG: DUF1499 domain-containing protein, partial [Owenweeksia sp.]
GLIRGRLNPCPDLANCKVSMYPQDTRHHMKPWFYHKSREEIREFLLEILNNEKGAQILENKENYLHAVYTVPIMKFKDDLEFFLPESTNVIHFRSASRVGYSDLGLNKRRLRRIQKKLSNNGIITI